MTRILANALTVSLENLPLEPDSVQHGLPRAAIRELTTFSGASVGVWELTEGTVTDAEVDEIFVVVSGAGQVEWDDGEIAMLAPGVVVRLSAGEQTTWRITESLRKVYLSVDDLTAE
jgi:uncharacterized cupin superfamily protein